LAIHDHRPDLNYLVTIAERIDEVLGRLSPGKTGLMFPLVQEFLLATDDDLAALAIACNDNDTQRFLDLLHRIKGGARIIGADQLVRCCTDWEQSPRLSWCMRSVVRQLDIIYGHIREAISYWERSRSIH
ncbi:MAG: Hpt domain-containing protein, partial [Shewanella sp.]